MIDALKIVGEIEIAKLSLKPGDVLAVKLPERRIPAQVIERVRDAIKAKLPDGVECMVFEAGVELSVIERAAPQSGAIQ